jgi:hypothetical protein
MQIYLVYYRSYVYNIFELLEMALKMALHITRWHSLNIASGMVTSVPNLQAPSWALRLGATTIYSRTALGDSCHT